jgi:uncharacterized protein
MRLLPDVNVWVALAGLNHSHHVETRSWFDSVVGNDSICFCRATQQGFLRLITEPAIFGTAAVSNDKAWDAYLALKLDPRISWVNEPEGVEDVWTQYALRPTRSPKIWMDAYLAALARLHGMRLVSFDKGFRVYEGLDWLDLGTVK